MAKKKSITSDTFEYCVENDTAKTIRLVRESMEAKRSQERVVRFKVSSQNVTIRMSDGLKMKVTVSTTKKDKKVYEEDTLPELFIKHVKHYLANLNWTTEKIKIITAGKKCGLFNILAEKGLKVIDEPICGWRGVQFIVENKKYFDIYAFSPVEMSYKYMASKPNKETATIFAENLANGKCFKCRVKLGTSTMCSDHQEDNTLNSYAW